MIIYPAIDLKEGKCVRLYKGDMTRDTVYNDNPCDQAMKWAQLGFSWLHVVDLDGAVSGNPVNHKAVRKIIETVDIPVQLGGGIRNMAQIERWLREGVSRVILGSIAVRDPDLVKEACREFPGQIAVGIDAIEGMVMVNGWLDKANIDYIELAQLFEDAGVSAIIFTDISRDGTGQGVNIVSTISLAQAVSIPIIASGGAHSLDDIRNVKETENYGVNGMIIGKALYEETIDPVEALKIAA
ncbi:MAG: 1-(5-phosphoribosyl)-5-[(5-phosphoribosylamino)methylideneamino]imidazole-4-carboxamide isomerase [Alphaproteobacteria bacterium]